MRGIGIRFVPMLLVLALLLFAAAAPSSVCGRTMGSYREMDVASDEAVQVTQWAIEELNSANASSGMVASIDEILSIYRQLVAGYNYAIRVRVRQERVRSPTPGCKRRSASFHAAAPLTSRAPRRPTFPSRPRLPSRPRSCSFPSRKRRRVFAG